MKASLLLVLGCAAVLAAGARAETPGEPEVLLQKVREYAQKATAAAKAALSTVQESEAAQQARRWLADHADLAQQRLAWLREQLTELWKRRAAA